MPTTPTTTKPKRRRAKRARKPSTVAMNQQTPLKVELPMIPESTKPNRVDPRPDVQLISRDAYWSDFLSRKRIHDYEVAEAMDDLKVAVAFTQRMAKKLYAKILEVAP